MSETLLVRLAKALDDASVPYMIIGGQAVLLYGEPRLTRDIDVTVGLTPADVQRVLRVVQRLGLRPLVEDVEDFVSRTWVLPALDENTGLRVDFVFSWTSYEREAIKRARTILVESYSVRFASPEDVVIHKILAGRARDLEDVRSILRKQRVDVSYIRQWLHEFDAALDGQFVTRFDEILDSLAS